jgi:hypothetical protein
MSRNLPFLNKIFTRIYSSGIFLFHGILNSRPLKSLHMRLRSIHLIVKAWVAWMLPKFCDPMLSPSPLGCLLINYALFSCLNFFCLLVHYPGFMNTLISTILKIFRSVIRDIFLNHLLSTALSMVLCTPVLTLFSCKRLNLVLSPLISFPLTRLGFDL